MSRLNSVPLACIGLMLLLSAATYIFLPQIMAVHWSLSLQPDGFARKPVAVLVLPIIGALVICMQLIGRYVSSDGGLQIQFSRAVIFALPILLIAHGGIIVFALVSQLPGWR